MVYGIRVTLDASRRGVRDPLARRSNPASARIENRDDDPAAAQFVCTLISDAPRATLDKNWQHFYGYGTLRGA
jgi:hypothetical protein